MKRGAPALLTVGLALLTAAIATCGRRRKPVQRIGMVIGMCPDKIAAYEALHEASQPGVRDLLTRYNMHNFSIFLAELGDGRCYLFGYYEYIGTDYRRDMENLYAEPRNQDWLSKTDPMQIPLPGERSWSVMREVYFNP